MEEKYFLTRGKAILFGLILIIVLIVYIIVKTNENNSVKKYKDFEKELVTGARNYTDIKSVYLENGEEKKIDMKDILKVYMTDNKLKSKCKGYVIISSEKNIVSSNYQTIYRAYINCGKYITTNYSEY